MPIKLNILFVLLLFCTLVACHNNNKEVTKEISSNKLVYEYEDRDLRNSIELKKTKDSITGTYFGVIINYKKLKLVYYKSYFAYSRNNSQDTSSNKNQISFKLDKFTFSMTPFDEDGGTPITDLSLIPPFSSMPMIFYGKFYGQILELNRYSGVMEGSPDYMIFIKKGYKNEPPVD